MVTNNHYRGKGIANAVMLQAELAGRPMPAPKGVVAQYGKVLAGYAETADRAAEERRSRVPTRRPA